MHGSPVTAAGISDLQKNTGIAPGIVSFFVQWPKPESEYNNVNLKKSLSAIKEAGAVPCLTWEPMYIQGKEEKVIEAGIILNGQYDEYIRLVAGTIRDHSYPVLVRFAHEMNLDRYHWGTQAEDYGPESPAIYRQMYRYVVKKAREAGAENALWVFCPNAESVPNPGCDPQAAWNAASNYYPGDDWVDVLGMDGYNWGTTQTEAEDGWTSRWQEFKDIFQPIRKELTELAPDKPLFVMETASVKRGGDREKWLAEAVETTKKWGLAGVVWFQEDKEQDWRLTVREGGMLSDDFIGAGEEALSRIKGTKDAKR